MQISFIHSLIYITLVLCERLLLPLIYSIASLKPSVISLMESASIVEVLPLLPAVVRIYFVAPGFTLSELFSGISLLSSVSIIEVCVAVCEGFLLFLEFLFLELSLVVLLVVDCFEAWKSFVRGDTTLSFQNVHHDAVGSLLDSLPGESCFLSKASLVAEFALITEVVDTVKELASLSILAVTLLLVLTAHLRLVV